MLVRWGNGDEAALEQLIPLVHRELHQVARRCMAGERAGHSLQATALVNEVYLKLVDAPDVDWKDRAHFLAVAARIMRRILVDHARARQSQKRGGDAAKMTFDEALLVSDDPRTERASRSAPHANARRSCTNYQRIPRGPRRSCSSPECR